MRFSQTRHHTEDTLSAEHCIKDFPKEFSAETGGCCLGIDEAGRGPVLGKVNFQLSSLL
jgi:hypothetical protein